MFHRVKPLSRSWLGRFAVSFLLALFVAAPCMAAKAEPNEDDASEAGTSEDATEKKADTAADDEQAKDTNVEKPKGEEKAPDDSYGHGGQLGLRAGLVAGYRMVLRYDDQSPYCAPPDPSKAVADQNKFCGYGAPLALDVGLSFGVLDFLEPFAWGRFGLAADTNSDTNPLILIGAGLRLYTMSDAAFKIFIEPAVALELESGRGTAAWQTNSPKYSKDFVFHLAAGPQLDFHENFGVYLTGGISMAVVRALGSSLDLNLGLQARYP